MSPRRSWTVRGSMAVLLVLLLLGSGALVLVGSSAIRSAPSPIASSTLASSQVVGLGSAISPGALSPTAGSTFTGSPGLVAHNVIPAGMHAEFPQPCGGVTNWVAGSSNFFTDVNVCYSIPYDRQSPNLPTVPDVGTIPQYALGFYINISTNVKVIQASVCLWATTWPVPGVGSQAVAGFDPANWNTQDCYGMNVGAPLVSGASTGNPETASFYVDCYKYFFPGTNLSWGISVTSGLGNIKSWNTLSVPEDYNTGYDTSPTWEAVVQAPFASTNFSADAQVRTIPSALSAPAYSPNPDQPAQIEITSINQSGGPAQPIPAANATVGILPPGPGQSIVYEPYNFGPSNNTTMFLTAAIPPQKGGTLITFTITLFMYWKGLSRIDLVTSQTFNFTYSSTGTLPYPNAPLEDNAQISSYPNVISTHETYLPTGTGVNVTVHEPIQNVTFTGAEVDYEFQDRGASVLGSIPMVAISQNTDYVHLPGLPPAASLTFSVIVRDINGNPDASGNYTYSENGSSVPVPPVFHGFFYLEVYDVATNHFLTRINYTVSNLSWFQNSYTNRFGFGYLTTGVGGQPVYLAFGTYLLTVHALGSTVARNVLINSQTPYTVVFYVSTTTVTTSTSSPPSILYTMAGTIGLAGAGAMVYPFRRWFKQRRAKAEAEQRRVTL